MRYKRSEALIEYQSRQKEIGNLLSIIKERQTMAHPGQVAPVIRAAIVLLYSHIEGYVEGVVEEAIQTLNNSGIVASQLPQTLRMAHCMHKVDELHQAQDPTRKEELLGDILARSMPFINGSTLPPARIEPYCLVHDFANPNVDHITQLFKKLGIQNVFSSMFRLGFPGRRVEPVMSTLEVLASLRHDIAHGNFHATCSHQDLVRYATVMYTFCKCVDARLGKHVEEMTGTYPWTA